MSNVINWGSINEDEFQNLCNSLYGFEHNKFVSYKSFHAYNAQGRDNGIDGYDESTQTIYQYKFHKQPGNRKVIKDAKDELKKIQCNYLTSEDERWKKAKKWVLVTNIDNSGTLENEWEEKIVKEHKKNVNLTLQLETTVDLEALLIMHPNVKEHFFEKEEPFFFNFDETQKKLKKEGHALDQDLIGRENELKACCNFFDSSETRLDFTGTGGVGKTRFLFECMRRASKIENVTLYWANTSVIEDNPNWHTTIPQNPTKKCVIFIDEPKENTIKNLNALSVEYQLVVINSHQSSLNPRELAPLNHDDIRLIGSQLLSNMQPVIGNQMEALLSRFADISEGLPIWTFIMCQLIQKNWDETKSISCDLTDRLTICNKYIERGIQSIPTTICTPLQANDLLNWLSLYQSISTQHDNVINFLTSEIGAHRNHHIINILDEFVRCHIVKEEKGTYQIAYALMAMHIRRNLLLRDNKPSYFSEKLCHRILDQNDFIQNKRDIIRTMDQMEFQFAKPIGLLAPVAKRLKENTTIRPHDAFEVAKKLYSQPACLLAICKRIRKELPSDPLIQELPGAISTISQYAVDQDRQTVISELVELAPYDYPPFRTKPKGALETIIFSGEGAYDDIAKNTANELIPTLKYSTQHAKAFEYLINPLISIKRTKTEYKETDSHSYIHPDPQKREIRDELLKTVWSLLVESTQETNRHMVLEILTNNLTYTSLEINRHPDYKDLHDLYHQDVTVSLTNLLTFIKAPWASAGEKKIARRIWKLYLNPDRRDTDENKKLAMECETQYLSGPYYSDFDSIMEMGSHATQLVHRVLNDPNANGIEGMIKAAVDFFSGSNQKELRKGYYMKLICDAMGNEYKNPKISHFVGQHIGSTDNKLREVATTVLATYLHRLRETNQSIEHRNLLKKIKDHVQPDQHYDLLTTLYSSLPLNLIDIDFEFFISMIDPTMSNTHHNSLITMWTQFISFDWQVVKRGIEDCLKGLRGNELASTTYTFINTLINTLRTQTERSPNLKLSHDIAKWVFDRLNKLSFCETGEYQPHHQSEAINDNLQQLTESSGFKYSIKAFADILNDRIKRSALTNPFRILPYHQYDVGYQFDFFQLVHTISSDPHDKQEVKKVLKDLFEFLESKYVDIYPHPYEWLVRLDPEGLALPEMIVEKIQYATQHNEIATLKRMGKYASQYPEASAPWQQISRPISRFATVNIENKEELLRTLANDTPHTESHSQPNWEELIENDKKLLDAEVDESLQEFYKLRMEWYRSKVNQGVA